MNPYQTSLFETSEIITTSHMTSQYKKAEHQLRLRRRLRTRWPPCRMRQGRPLSSVDLQPFAQRTQRLRLHRRALSRTHVPIHGMPRLQLLSVRGVSREHIRMAFSLWLLPRQGIAEHYFFGVFILLRATISEEDSPRVAIAVIPEQCAKRRPPFSSSWQIGREIQCSCPRQERCQEPRKQWNRLFRYRLFE